MNILIQLSTRMIEAARFYLFVISIMPSVIICRAAMATYLFFLPEELRVARSDRYQTEAEEIDWPLIAYHAELGDPEVKAFYEHARNHFHS